MKENEENNNEVEISFLDEKEQTKRFEIKNLQFLKIPKDTYFVGEKVADDLEIYINYEVVKFVEEFALSDTSRELGGVLIGNIYRYREKPFLLIDGAIEAKYSESSSATMKFTHKSWEYINSIKESKYPTKKIIGWFHTHPTFGIFLSDYDKFIHQNFFNAPYQVAYVVDPINKQKGFFQWKNNEISKCSGYSIVGYTPPEEKPEEKKVYPLSIGIIRDAAVILLLILSLFLLSKINDLEMQNIKMLNNQKEFLAQIEAIKKDIKKLDTHINKLEKQNKKLEEEKEKLKGEIALLEKESKNSIKKLQKKINEMDSIIKKISEKIEKEEKFKNK
jgi:proteasome lid subunit RPN8/RPN11/cell division protein FtsB